MLLKISGAIIIALASTAFGCSLCNEYKRKLLFFKEFNQMLYMLEGNIKHKNCFILEALKEIKIKNGLLSLFINKVTEILENENCSVKEAWEYGVIITLKDNKGFKTEETDMIMSFGQNLGITDRETQIKYIEMYIENTNRYIEQLDSVKKEKIKLYKTLSALSGLFIIIVLI
jgi:stage III sporulation protein AB